MSPPSRACRARRMSSTENTAPWYTVSRSSTVTGRLMSMMSPFCSMSHPRTVHLIDNVHGSVFIRFQYTCGRSPVARSTACGTSSSA